MRPPPCVHQVARRHSCAPAMTACTDHLLSLHPGLIERAKVRQMSTTKEPPPLVYVYQTPRQNRKPSRQFREYIQPISTSSEETEEMYDELLSLARRRRHQQHQPRHFGLSTFGHLKIDYSCNWSNLDRYIAHV
ncbi:uncharacterized protein LOC129004223 [Macrosteles quadrilineatus]|uniref:uncharacterized protein LOC129004223 n=1 Tax=Macrosteles quadrilineatus TaxID=74068 RepID=UPI0023E20715|nr:uncharacterized protein LOC129004223 [Macrosteles quadrilineatus]